MFKNKRVWHYSYKNTLQFDDLTWQSDQQEKWSAIDKDNKLAFKSLTAYLQNWFDDLANKTGLTAIWPLSTINPTNDIAQQDECWHMKEAQKDWCFDQGKCSGLTSTDEISSLWWEAVKDHKKSYHQTRERDCWSCNLNFWHNVFVSYFRRNLRISTQWSSSKTDEWWRLKCKKLKDNINNHSIIEVLESAYSKKV